ncbi:RHS repeat domain-containing protein [Acinetobacter bereziniae]|uniref:RHS repeat domain-containing protein n=1 Tax=Acinetobacter bereziniae TaxID=106648 RepID=UPI001D18A6B3|nr:RHS repeat-associated core domain-containing protein [Acinetobacter bereziniae]
MKNNKLQSNKVWSFAVQLMLLSFVLLLSQLTLAKDRIQYHVQNFDGSTLKVINEQGVVSQSYQYAPFGQQLQYKKPSNLKNPNAFVGGVQDADDLVYLKQRHYNSVLGRFYQPDPVTFLEKGHGQTNRYQYGWNDTYTFSDSNGENSNAIQTLPVRWQQNIEIFGLQLTDKIESGLKTYSYTFISVLVPELVLQRLSIVYGLELSTWSMTAPVSTRVILKETQLGVGKFPLPANMSPPQFGKLAGWGTKPEGALLKLQQGYTSAEIQAIKNSGITRTMVEQWKNTYNTQNTQRLLRGSDVSTPETRAKLMQMILDKW